MVGIASDESPVRESTERSILVLAALLGHKRLYEYAGIIAFPVHFLYFETTGRCRGEGVVDLDYVVDVPTALICEGAVTVRKQFLEGIEKIQYSRFLDGGFAVQPYFLAVVGGIVIHISHNGDFYSGVLLHHSEGVIVDDFSPARTQVSALASHAGRQMGYVKGKMQKLYLEKSLKI